MFRSLARQKESKALEGHIMVDHVHMPVSIPPGYPVSGVRVPNAFPILRFADGHLSKPMLAERQGPQPQGAVPVGKCQSEHPFKSETV